eukprot:4111311-Pyramimonas_sp.AAC.1
MLKNSPRKCLRVRYVRAGVSVDNASQIVVENCLSKRQCCITALHNSLTSFSITFFPHGPRGAFGPWLPPVAPSLTGTGQAPELRGSRRALAPLGRALA